MNEREIGFLRRLEELMERKGLSRREAAIAAGINTNTFQGYWKYRRIPRGDDLVSIAASLGTTAEFLITGKQSGSGEDDTLLRETAELLKGMSERERLQVYGAVKMLVYMNLSGSPR